MKKRIKRSPGIAGEFMITGLCILAMSVIMVLYIQCAGLIQQKLQTGQLARKYILKMETCGYLDVADQSSLLTELQSLGIMEADISGTTFAPAGYGETIELKIMGKLKGGFEIFEYRTSTAKY